MVSEHIDVTPRLSKRRLPRLMVVAVAAPVLLPEPAPLPQTPVQAVAVPPPAAAPKAEPVAAPAGGTKEAGWRFIPRDGRSRCGHLPRAATLPGSRLPGPQVCKANGVWAQLRADGKDISPDGTALSPP